MLQSSGNIRYQGIWIGHGRVADLLFQMARRICSNAATRA